MNKKIFWFDTETTGLNAKKQDIIQLAYLVDINGEIKEEGNFYIQPFDYKTIDNGALELSGIKIEDLKTYPKPQLIYSKLVNILDKYVDKYNRKDKFHSAGYNVRFDVDFLREFFFKNNNKYYGSYFDYHVLDPITFLYFMEYKGLIKLENYKLETVAKYFNINFEAHNALEDIKTTRKIIQKLLPYLKI